MRATFSQICPRIDEFCIQVRMERKFKYLLRVVESFSATITNNVSLLVINNSYS